MAACCRKLRSHSGGVYRYSYLASTLMKRYHHVLMAGAVGVGKTMIAEALIGNLPERSASMTINFSAQTSSNSLQVHLQGHENAMALKQCLGNLKSVCCPFSQLLSLFCCQYRIQDQTFVRSVFFLFVAIASPYVSSNSHTSHGMSKHVHVM